MKIVLRLLLILFAASFSMLAFGYQLTEAELKSEIISQVKKEAQKYTDGEIDVKITGLNFAGLKTASQSAPEIKVISNFSKFMYRDIKRVVVADNGAYLASIPVNVNILVYKDVLAAKNDIRPFDTLSSSNTELKRSEIGMRLNDVMTELNPNKPVIASRNFVSGDLVLKCYTKSKPDIVRNSGVNIIFASGDGLNIQTEGVALGEGNEGDLVLVRSLKYNKVHSATVIGQNEVVVRI